MNWWDVFVEKFSQFWNAPVPIIGFTVGACIIGIVVIIGKTSIGRKALLRITAMFDYLKDEIKMAIKMFNDLKDNKENEIKELTEKFEDRIKQIEQEKEFAILSYEEKIEKLEDELHRAEELLTSVASNFNNVKVKMALKEYKDGE